MVLDWQSHMGNIWVLEIDVRGGSTTELDVNIPRVEKESSSSAILRARGTCHSMRKYSRPAPADRGTYDELS